VLVPLLRLLSPRQFSFVRLSESSLRINAAMAVSNSRWSRFDPVPSLGDLAQASRGNL
jgi:hypothetical protein